MAYDVEHGVEPDVASELPDVEAAVHGGADAGALHAGHEAHDGGAGVRRGEALGHLGVEDEPDGPGDAAGDDEHVPEHGGPRVATGGGGRRRRRDGVLLREAPVDR